MMDLDEPVKLRSTRWSDPSAKVIAVVWVIVAVLALGANLATGGEMGLDGDVVRFDGSTIELQVRDFGDRERTPAEIAERERTNAPYATERVFRAAAYPWDERVFYLLAGAQILTVLAGALCLERLLRRASRAQLFAEANVVWLRLLAACFAVGTIVLPVLMHRWEEGVIRSGTDFTFSTPRIEPLTHGPGMSEVVVVVVLVLLAEVWRRGTVLRRDAEATI